MSGSRRQAPGAEIDAARRRIDDIDAMLVDLISERAALAQRIGAAKARDDAGGAFYRPEREAQVLRRVLERNPGPLDDAVMARLIREVMSACLALEQVLTVGYLGPEGTFTEAAARKHFGAAIEQRPLEGINEVFRAVETGACDYGVVPVENSIEGSVNLTLDALVDTPARICGEVELGISEHLLGRGTLEEVQVVYAHPQALAQCRAWLREHLPRARQVPVASNGEAARLAAGERGAAALAAREAAAIYGLEVLAEHVEDRADNTTRFLVIGRHEVAPSGRDKTSLLFTTSNRPGALYRALAVLADAGISMTRIESRPSRRGTWDYQFFVDVEGHAQLEPLAGALGQLGERTAMLKLLGSYPRAVV